MAESGRLSSKLWKSAAKGKEKKTQEMGGAVAEINKQQRRRKEKGRPSFLSRELTSLIMIGGEKGKSE